MTPLTLSMCISSARRAADGAWGALGPSGFSWLDALGPRPLRGKPTRIGTGMLAQFVAANPHATAEQLYAFTVAGDDGAAAWADIPRELRVAIEVFRATFAVLYQMHEADRKAREGVNRLTIDGPAINPALPVRAVDPGVPLEPKGNRYPARKGGPA